MESAIWDWAKTQGPFAILLVTILWSGAVKKWVWGWTYQELKADRDFWRSLHFRTVDVAKQAVTIVEKVTVP